MGIMIVKRLLLLPLVLLGVSLGLFIISQIIPADPARLLISDYASPEVRANIEAKLGLDQPAIVQYGLYMGRVLQGDLGESFRYRQPVFGLLRAAFPATLQLVILAGVIAVVLTFILGFLAARYRDTPIDAFVRGIAMLGIATPAFYLGIVLILVFGFYLGWFPISGRGDPPDLYHAILPAFVLGFRDAGSSARVLRANLLDTTSEDYVRAARARGLGEKHILFRIVGRNALIPTVTDLGLGLASIAGSVILVETVFAWPGIGRLLYIGIQFNDFPLISGALLLLLTWVVVVNLVVDILYRLIDPRVREE